MKKKSFYVFNQIGQTSDLTPEQTQQLFRKQEMLPDGRYMPESPHFNDEKIIDFKEKENEGGIAGNS